MSNYAEYICKGAHCKCMEKDCTKFHNGDHTCPSSTPMTPQHKTNELQEAFEFWDDYVARIEFLLRKAIEERDRAWQQYEASRREQAALDE